MKARDIMITDVPTISRKTSLKDAVLKLKKNYGDKSFLNAAPGLVVVNEWGELSGVLMPLTIMQALLEDTTSPDPSTKENMGSFEHLCDKIKDKLVEDVMEREPISVTEDALLIDIASLFVRYRFQRIPVVRDKKVVGIIYRTPLLFAMTNSLFK
ncbi:MAG: CBS domain protein [Syntrophus sp. PtaB.Bin138]|nr:MAG: CBS domain protein [Syntrophus sp. PtaB.Bin138]